MGEASASHPLPQSALFEEILFQAAKLPVNEVIGLMDQSEGDVRDHIGRARLHELLVQHVGLWKLAPKATDV
jgi:hypothetical protein